jgi:hypothetical protein
VELTKLKNAFKNADCSAHDCNRLPGEFQGRKDGNGGSQHNLDGLHGQIRPPIASAVVVVPLDETVYVVNRNLVRHEDLQRGSKAMYLYSCDATASIVAS